MCIESLRELTVIGKYPWEVFFADEDIRATELYARVKKFSGLTSFETELHWVPNSRLSGMSNGHRTIWTTNIKKFERQVSAEVSRPRQPLESEEQMITDSTLTLGGTFTPDETTTLNGTVQVDDSDSEEDSEFDEGFDLATTLELLLLEQFKATIESQPGDVPDSEEHIIKMIANDPRKIVNWICSAKKELEEARIVSDIQKIDRQIKEASSLVKAIKARLLRTASPRQAGNKRSSKADAANKGRSKGKSISTETTKVKARGTKENFKMTAQKSAKPRFTSQDLQFLSSIMALLTVFFLWTVLMLEDLG